ncbi:unnamed protein product [Closterium sp. NIES-53]
MAPMQPSLGPPRDEPRVFELDKFNGDNFAEWSFKMENIFDHYDLLEVMEGTEKRPENDPEKNPWVRKSAQGYLLLGQALGSNNIRHIKPFQREPEKGPKAWAALKDVHAPATAAVAVVLERQMAALQIEEDEAVEEGVQKFFDFLTRLEGADLNYSELQKKTKLLALLPESWSSLIINLNRDLPRLSLEDVKRAILKRISVAVSWRVRMAPGQQASAEGMAVEGAEDEGEADLAATSTEATGIADTAMTTRTTDAVVDGSTASVIFATRADTCGAIASSSLMDGPLLKAKRVEEQEQGEEEAVEAVAVAEVVLQNPHWMRIVRFFLARPGLHSLHLCFSDLEQLPTLGACIAHSSHLSESEGLVFESQCVHFGHPSAGGCQRSAGDPRLIIGKGYRLVVLGGYGHIDLLLNKSFYPNGTVCSSMGQESKSWPLGFLKDCAQLQELNLGRGMWKLNSQRVNTAWFKSIRKLTLEQVHYESMRFQFLKIITRQLHEFTLYEDGNVLREHPCVASTTTLAFTFPNARLLRFRFASAELHLTLTVPPSLETLSVVAKQLVLSCKSSAALALHHLSLYGKDQLVISSLRLASARVVYLDGPAMEVLIVRHGVLINKVEAEWGRLRNLGIVVPPWDRSACTMAGCAFLGWMNRNISVQSRMRKWMRMTKCLMMLKMMMRMRMMMMMTMMVLVILVVTIMTGCFGQCMVQK